MARAAFGGYQIVEQIGRGAAGTVFVAEHGRLRHQVAIKVLHPHLIGDAWEQRMLTEADVLSRIDHPGIVKVFDLGIADDGRAFVVMEYLAGESLHARLRRARLPEGRVVAFARQLASALGAAHTAGVVHRDLKPENVLVVRDPALPGGERVKLLDFGVAKRRGTEQTPTGIVLGTPAYMAPEQFMVGSRHVDPRADVYSLGVLLYQMATGSRPFAGRDTDELLAEHAYAMPAPASEAGAVSHRLSAIIARCLAKHPDDRFATMAELEAALRALEQAAPAARRLEDLSTLVFVTLEDAPTDTTTNVVLDSQELGAVAADATTNVVLGSQELDADPITNLIPASAPPPVHAPVHAPAPPHARIAGRPRIAGRSVRWVLALAAAAAAGTALALGYGLGGGEMVADAAVVPAANVPADRADHADSADSAGARPGPIELPAAEAIVHDPPSDPAEISRPAVGGEPALSVAAAMLRSPRASAGSAGPPRARPPARVPRLRINHADTGRKPAKERSYDTVSAPTLF